MAATLDMPSLGKFYRRQLLEDVLPFWFPRAYDEKNGGLYHCFDADGTLVDSDKSVWVEKSCCWQICADLGKQRILHSIRMLNIGTVSIAMQWSVCI